MTDLNASWARASQLAAAGDIDGAIAACDDVLGLHPDHSGAHLLLAGLLQQRDAWRRSCEHALRAATRMGRQPLEHIASVSLRLIASGEYERASQVIHRMDPARVPVPHILAELSSQLGLLEEHAESLRYMDAAIALGARDPSVGYLRGNTLKFLGRLDEATAEYERSLEQDPDFAYAHWALAYLGHGGDGAGRASRIRATLSRVTPAHPDIAYLHYALFRELDGLGDTDGAWAALAEGARAKRGRVQYSGADEARLFQLLEQATPASYLAAGDGLVDADREPIFVLGLPRTGTTLLERVLGGHPDVTLCGELNDFRMQLKWAADHYCLGYLDEATVARLPGVDHGVLGSRYLDHVRWRVPATRRFSDKSPGNFQLVGTILRALPRARIVHLRRHPMDSCFSNLKELFAANAHPYSYDLGDLAAHYGNYSRLMAHWHAIAPGRILDVHYEDLVSAPEEQARRVMDFCGLEYDPAQVRVESRAAPVSTASSAQVRQPIHARNVGGWKRYAGPLEPLRRALGDAAG
jgi:tetratricopeptide (TPR) repeat protein